MVALHADGSWDSRCSALPHWERRLLHFGAVALMVRLREYPATRATG